jgi:outer membrane protein assembly factor BamB
MNQKKISRLLYSGALVLGTAVQAADWPQYRGPNHDGIAPEPAALRSLKPDWKIPTALGFSSFALAEGRAYTQVVRAKGGGPREWCVAFEAKTGKELWAADIGAGSYPKGGDAGTPENRGGDGPRSTPTINEGLVYVCTQDIVVQALDAKTGQKVWSHDVIQAHNGRNIKWNSAASPVVDGDLLFVAGGGAGQSLLALNKKSGDVAWKTGDEIITHSTPVVATLHGVRQVIFFLKSGLVAVAVADGKELWRFPFKFSVSTAISPVVCGDIVYCSAGYGVGGGACRVGKSGDKFSAQELWKIEGDKLVANHWSTPVHKDGHLYGMFSFKKFGSGPLKCVEVATGKIKWEQPGFGAGNVTLVGSTLVALADDGHVALVEATPAAYKEIARLKAVGGKCWSTPAFSDGHIFVRSTKEGACLAVSP